jgi:hypothetical protein
VVLAALSLLAGCRHAPELTPRLLGQADARPGFWLDAPYVLVVTIARTEFQGSREPAFKGGPKTLQLVKFTANVENVLKGDLPDKTITFYYFANAVPSPGILDPGHRYVVSVRREGGKTGENRKTGEGKPGENRGRGKPGVEWTPRLRHGN